MSKLNEPMKSFLSWFNNLIGETDEYIGVSIFDQYHNEYSVEWRQSSPASKCKYNDDCIVVWHKGWPIFYIRHKNSLFYTLKHDMITIDDNKIYETMNTDEGIFCLSCHTGNGGERSGYAGCITLIGASEK